MTTTVDEGQVIIRSADAHMCVKTSAVLKHIPSSAKAAAEQLLDETLKMNEAGGKRSLAMGRMWPAHQRPGGIDPAERLKDMDLDGITTEVLYGDTRYGGVDGAQFLGLKDRGLRTSMVSAYNDALCDLRDFAPGRFVPACVVPIVDVEEGVEEVRRLAKHGVRAVRLTADPHNEGIATPYWDAHWDPLWSVAQETGIPLHFHLGAGYHELKYVREVDPTPGYDGTGNIARVLPPIFMSEFVTSWILTTLLRRFPDLKLVLVEAGIGWIPYLLERLDSQARRHDWAKQGTIQEKPSTYWFKHFMATFEDDLVGVSCRHLIGVDNIMWASDYPHSDSTWPESRKVVDETFRECPPAEKQKMISGNAAKLYQLD